MAHSSARPRSASLLQHVLKGKEVKPVLVGAVTGIGITAGLSALWLVPRLPDAAPSPGMQSAWDRTEEEDEVEEVSVEGRRQRHGSISEQDACRGSSRTAARRRVPAGPLRRVRGGRTLVKAS